MVCLRDVETAVHTCLCTCLYARLHTFLSKHAWSKHVYTHVRPHGLSPTPPVAEARNCMTRELKKKLHDSGTRDCRGAMPDIHVCTHVYAHVYTHLHTHVHKRVCTHVHTHVCTHVRAPQTNHLQVPCQLTCLPACLHTCPVHLNYPPPVAEARHHMCRELTIAARMPDKRPRRRRAHGTESQHYLKANSKSEPTLHQSQHYIRAKTRPEPKLDQSQH